MGANTSCISEPFKVLKTIANSKNHKTVIDLYGENGDILDYWLTVKPCNEEKYLNIKLSKYKSWKISLRDVPSGETNWLELVDEDIITSRAKIYLELTSEPSEPSIYYLKGNLKLITSNNSVPFVCSGLQIRKENNYYMITYKQ